jgi:hypothetical protein
LKLGLGVMLRVSMARTSRSRVCIQCMNGGSRSSASAWNLNLNIAIAIAMLRHVDTKAIDSATWLSCIHLFYNI